MKKLPLKKSSLKKLPTLFAYVLFLTIGFSLTGCVKTVRNPKPPAGRCFDTTNCPQGTHCVDNWCEDMYSPRKHTKNY